VRQRVRETLSERATEPQGCLSVHLIKNEMGTRTLMCYEFLRGNRIHSPPGPWTLRMNKHALPFFNRFSSAAVSSFPCPALYAH